MKKISLPTQRDAASTLETHPEFAGDLALQDVAIDDERDSWIIHLGVHPLWDPLRSHPRYQSLLRKMNLE